MQQLHSSTNTEDSMTVPYPRLSYADDLKVSFAPRWLDHYHLGPGRMRMNTCKAEEIPLNHINFLGLAVSLVLCLVIRKNTDALRSHLMSGSVLCQRYSFSDSTENLFLVMDFNMTRAPIRCSTSAL